MKPKMLYNYRKPITAYTFCRDCWNYVQPMTGDNRSHMGRCPAQGNHCVGKDYTCDLAVRRGM